MKTTIVALGLILMTIGMSVAQYPNILLGNLFYPEEPSVAINPKHPHQLVVGANITNVYHSSDAGLSWSSGVMSSSYGVWGDPCIIVDTASHFYYFHLSNPSTGSFIDRIVCQKSIDGGATWSDGTYMGLVPGKQQDKEWAVVDQATNNIYVTWTQFDQYGSANPLDSSIIRFSRSLDGGATWSEAVRINQVAGDCIDSDNTVEGAVPAVGPNGEIYVAWAGPAGLVFTKSTDQGDTWPSGNVFVNALPGGWDYAIPGIYRANGMPVTCCDLSGGPYHGRIYINWSDQRNGEDDTDVWMTWSDNGGTTWEPEVRVNDDPAGKQQFFSWMAVDQTSGIVYVVFYDRRNYSDNLTDVYMAVSYDGGESFVNIRISESPFNPNASVFFGDYTNIAAHNGMVRPVWARLDDANLSVWMALVDSVIIGLPPGKKESNSLCLQQNYPNPASGYTCFPFKIHTPSYVSLTLRDMMGRKRYTMIDNRFYNTGKYVERFDLSRFDLPPGLYCVSLSCDGQTLQRKMIIE